MMHQLELVVPRWKLNPKNLGPDIKSIKFLGSGVKGRVGRVSGNNRIFRPKARPVIVCTLTFKLLPRSGHMSVCLSVCRTSLGFVRCIIR